MEQIFIDKKQTQKEVKTDQYEREIFDLDIKIEHPDKKNQNMAWMITILKKDLEEK